VGDSPAAVNHGFDDVEKTSGWTMPTKLQPGNWENMVTNYPTLADLAGIQCENCHGPQDGAIGHLSTAHTSSGNTTPDKWTRVSFSEGVCASCHQDATHHYKPSQWQTSAHAQRELVSNATLSHAEPTAAHLRPLPFGPGICLRTQPSWLRAMPACCTSQMARPPTRPICAGWACKPRLWRRSPVRLATIPRCSNPSHSAGPEI